MTNEEKELTMVQFQKMTNMMKDISEIQFTRESLVTLQPDFVQEAQDTETRKKAKDFQKIETEVIWDHPIRGYIFTNFYPKDYFPILKRMGDNWDLWDGKPTEYVSAEDILIARKDHRVTQSEFDQYIKLSADEKSRARWALGAVGELGKIYDLPH